MARNSRSARRIVVWAALATVALLLFSAVFVGCLLSAPRYSGLRRPNFDGDRFVNTYGAHDHGAFDFLKWQLDRDPGAWAEFTDAEPGPPPPERVGPGALRLTFVNHTTMLIQMDEVNILTDPIWSGRAGPYSWAGVERRRPPGLRFEDLPTIDAVLISHNHYDHLDLPTLKRLFERNRPRIYAGLGNRKLLRDAGITLATDLDWWQSATLGDRLQVTFVPARHFSGRGVFDRDATLWGGFVVAGPAGRVYFAGDTGFGPHFAEVRERLGPIRLALLPLGAFRPRWFMAPSHIGPDQAVEVHRILGARQSAAIHFGTFALGDDGQHEPVQALREALRKLGVPEEQFWVLGFGEGRDVPGYPSS